MDIAELRKEIDMLNQQILDILNHRAELVNQISKRKDENGADYFDPEREAEMMRMIYDKNKGPMPNELIKEIFTAIFLCNLKYMGVSRKTRLMISAECDNEFLGIKEIFNLKTDQPVIIAGPCAIENVEYLEIVAGFLKESGIKFIRGGAFKPRTSPYEFQGLKQEGLEILNSIGKKYNLITVTEVVDTRDVDTVMRNADVLQIGARNMQNFELLKEVGRTGKPIILKRGMSATIQEFMYAAEYIATQGSRKIIMCERGIRTYENQTRNTLDISSIPIIKTETKLPVLVDISHSLGRKDIINSVAKAALAAGADGLMVEVHPFPELALSDSKQQLNLGEFKQLLNAIGMS